MKPVIKFATGIKGKLSRIINLGQKFLGWAEGTIEP